MKKSLFFFAISLPTLAVFAEPCFCSRADSGFPCEEGAKSQKKTLATTEAEAKCTALKSRKLRPDDLAGMFRLYTSKDDEVEFDDTFSINSVYMWVKGYVAKDWYIFLSWYVHDPMLIDAKLTYEYTPCLKISAGQFLLPYSWEQLTSTPKLTRFYGHAQAMLLRPIAISAQW